MELRSVRRDRCCARYICHHTDISNTCFPLGCHRPTRGFPYIDHVGKSIGEDKPRNGWWLDSTVVTHPDTHSLRVLQAEGVLQSIEDFFTPILCCGPINNGAAYPSKQFSERNQIRGVRSMGPRLTAAESREKTDRLMQCLEDKTSGTPTNIEKSGMWCSSWRFAMLVFQNFFLCNRAGATLNGAVFVQGYGSLRATECTTLFMRFQTGTLTVW